jgi:hypothetical protein
MSELTLILLSMSAQRVVVSDGAVAPVAGLLLGVRDALALRELAQQRVAQDVRRNGDALLEPVRRLTDSRMSNELEKRVDEVDESEDQPDHGGSDVGPKNDNEVLEHGGPPWRSGIRRSLKARCSPERPWR